MKSVSGGFNTSTSLGSSGQMTPAKFPQMSRSGVNPQEPTTLINSLQDDDEFNHPTRHATSGYHTNVINWILLLLDRQRVSPPVPPSSRADKDDLYTIVCPYLASLTSSILLPLGVILSCSNAV